MSTFTAETESDMAVRAFIACGADPDALLAPLDEGGGAGVSLRYEPVYQQIRNAQQEDDPTLPMGVWERPLVKADWKAVAALCSDALATRSKDFQLAAWMTEAWTRLHRLDGFIAGLRCIAALIEDYWEPGWPRIDEDADARVAPFVWLNDALARALTVHLPLVVIDGFDLPHVNLDDWQRVVTGADLALGKVARGANGGKGSGLTQETLMKHAAYAGNRESLLTLYRQMDAANEAVQRVARMLDERLALDAPGFSNLEAVLRRLEQAVVSLMGERALAAAMQAVDATGVVEVVAGATADPSMPETAADAVVAAAEPVALAPLAGPISSRAHAYRLLETVADYLSIHEPHSPTPYLLRRALTWEHMSLAELMREIARQEGDLSRYLAMLGLE